MQLLFWYNAAYIFPSFTLGIPFGPALVHFNLNSWLTPFVVASLGLALNEGAYMSEIVRAGIISVDEGQTEAAQSMGMSRLMALRLIVLPQAMRVVIPPTGNETISMLKTTSLASVVAAPELLFRVEQIYAANYTIVPLLMVASLQYLWVTSVLMVGQYYLERHYAQGAVRQLPPTPLQRLRRWLVDPPRTSTGWPGWSDRRRYLRAVTPMSELMVRAEGVRKHFGRLEVLRGIDLEVRTGEVLCIIGPSGSGKSTFLRCINHLEKIDEGRLTVDGELVGYREHSGRLYELRDREVGQRRAQVGMVFQHFNLFPHMTALENVTVGPIKVKREEKARAVQSAPGVVATGRPE